MIRNNSFFNRFACFTAVSWALLCASAASADTINNRVFDWTDHGSGTYTRVDLGPDTINGQAGERWRKTVTQTAHAFDTLPLMPLPAELKYLVSFADYVVTSKATYILPYTATFSNDAGDTLLATGYLKSASGSNYSSEYTFTGGTGAFAGASGWWKTSGIVLSSSTQQWSGTVHLELPSPVPEPETYAMLLAGLGLLAAVARRRIRS